MYSTYQSVMASIQLLPDSKMSSGADVSGTLQVAEHGPGDRRGIIEDGVFATYGLGHLYREETASSA